MKPADPLADGQGTSTPLEIRVIDLHKAFGQNHVLQGIDLEIHRGEIVAIVGASGSGKTVLLKHLIGRIRPDKGQVLLADHELPNAPLTDLTTLNDIRMDELRQHWAVVFQKNALFTGTVQSNITLALTTVQGIDEAQSIRRAEEVLDWVGLDPKLVMPMPRDSLSGGMAKRVAIARAIALDPVLVFYDEPTSGLDPALCEQIQDLIRRIHEQPSKNGGQRTTVIITHDAGLLYRLEPRVVMLHEGRVSFDGSAKDFENSDSAIIRPYLQLMPLLHNRVPETVARPED